MTALEIQIVADYEQNGTSPEVIAADTGFELAAVKATLGQFSAKFRETEKLTLGTPAGHTVLVSPDELLEFQEIVKHLARCGETDSIRLKAASRLVDEGKGRLDRKKALSSVKRDVNVNIIQFNESLRAARQKMQEAIVEIKEIGMEKEA
jgi:hypothetical protein